MTPAASEPKPFASGPQSETSNSPLPERKHREHQAEAWELKRSVAHRERRTEVEARWAMCRCGGNAQRLRSPTSMMVVLRLQIIAKSQTAMEEVFRPFDETGSDRSKGCGSVVAYAREDGTLSDRSIVAEASTSDLESSLVMGAAAAVVVAPVAAAAGVSKKPRFAVAVEPPVQCVDCCFVVVDSCRHSTSS